MSNFLETCQAGLLACTDGSMDMKEEVTLFEKSREKQAALKKPAVGRGHCRQIIAKPVQVYFTYSRSGAELLQNAGS